MTFITYFICITQRTFLLLTWTLSCKINLYNIEDNLLSLFIISYQYPITLLVILIDNGTQP